MWDSLNPNNQFCSIKFPARGLPKSVKVSLQADKPETIRATKFNFI